MSKKKPKKDDENGFAEWGGYMGAKMQKLQQQYREDTVKNNPFKQSDLFAGISIHVNGLTNPTSDELKRIMMTHGGVFDLYHRPGATTFIVAQNLPDVKIRALAASKKLIISPDWIVDCVKEERLVDYSNYLLYTNVRTNQPTIDFARKSKRDGETNAKEPDVMMDTSEERSTSPVVENSGLNDTNLERIQSFMADDEDIFAEDDELPLSTESIQKAQSAQDDSEETKCNESRTDNIMDDLQFLNDQIRNAVFQSSESSSDSTLPTTTAIPTANASKQALTAVDANFLTEFYNNSRLHHIATLGAGFKNHISLLRESSDGTFPGRMELCNQFASSASGALVPMAIMHIDMDCFFVSVGLRERPHLRGQPVAVTHSKGGGRAALRPGADPQKERAMYEARRQISHGTTENRMETKTNELSIDGTDSLAEIASCSYEARRMGLKNGMFVGPALKLCPNLKTIPYDFEQYKEVAHLLYNTLAKYTLDIEAVSCDEMYVDLQSVLEATGLTAEQFVTHIRGEIQALTGCPCSAGVGANRLQARMATKRAKPNGQFFLHEHDVLEYFGNIAISDLPGVGYTTTHKLTQLDWKTCAELRNVTMAKLQEELGKKFGETLYQYCRGIDNKPLVFGQIRKSVSAEVNYGIRFSVESEFDAFLRQLCTEVHSRLTEIRHRGKSITLKLMVRSADAPVETAKFMGHGVCDHVTKTSTLTEFTNDAGLIERTVFSIKNGLGVDPRELRGVGIQISKLDSGGTKPNPAGNRLKTMFEVVAQKNTTLSKSAIANDTVIEPKRVLRNQRANSIDSRHVANRDRAVGRGAIRQTSDTDVLVNQGKQEATESKRGMRNQRANSIDRNMIQQQASKRGRKRGVGRGTTRQTSVTELLTNRGPNADSNPDSQLDMAVLAELPDDIREEALRAFRHNQMQSKKMASISPKKSIQVSPRKSTRVSPRTTVKAAIEPDKLCGLDQDFLAALPDDIRAEVVRDQLVQKQREQRNTEEAQLNARPSVESIAVDVPTIEPSHTEQEPISIENIFVQNDWRVQLQNWVDSTADEQSAPVQCDIEMVSDYAKEMIRLRRINELYLCFRYLSRIITEKRLCAWHRAYAQIVVEMQAEMRFTYGSRLQVKSIECAKCGGHPDGVGGNV